MLIELRQALISYQDYHMLLLTLAGLALAFGLKDPASARAARERDVGWELVGSPGARRHRCVAFDGVATRQCRLEPVSSQKVVEP